MNVDRGEVRIDNGEGGDSEIKLERDKSLTILVLPKEGNFSKTINIHLDGDNSHVEVLGVILGSGRQSSSLTVNTVHKGKNTSAYTHVRGVLFGESRTYFSGLIKIEKEADKTSSLLEDRVLILGEGAHAESIPSLEIEANDVRDSHAATVGKINETHLFYLMSRGIDRRTAMRMIVEGFFEPIFEKLGRKVSAKLFAEVRGKLWADLLVAKLQ